MNSYPLTTLWLKILALIAMEVGVVALVLLVVRRSCRTAVWRRTLCQAALITSLVLAFSELSGVGRSLVARVFSPQKNPWNIFAMRDGPEAPANQPQLDPVFRSKVISRLTRNQPQISEPGAEISPFVGSRRGSETEDSGVAQDFRLLASAATGERNLETASSHQTPITDTIAMLWLGMILGIGVAFVSGRACLGRLILILLGLRRRTVIDGELLRRVHFLAKSLRFSRRVRIVESRRLVSPIAFGLIRPTIGLPLNFCQRFSAGKQEAMLTHELAHLSAHDPFWYLVADLVAALFWWHPAIWWLRRQLHLSSELAADEASLRTADGPRVLAECLVEMGAQLARPALGQLRVAGFRSDLACRVQRLMRLEGAQWRPISRPRAVLAKWVGPLAVAGTVIFCTAWAVPRELTKGDSMKTMKQNWQRALATIATMAAIQTPTLVVGQENPAPTRGPASGVGVAANVAPAAPEAGATPNASPSPQSAGGEGFGITRGGSMAPGGGSFGLSVASGSDGPLPVAANPAYPAGQSGNPPHSGRLEARLREIVLDEVRFEGLPLSEVLMYLGDESHKRDPEKKGINFLINPNLPPNAPSAAASIDPATGLPIPAGASEAIDISAASVRFNMPLRHVTMADVLDAIVKVADRPIQYSVEDYAVIFSLRADANMMLPMAGRFNAGTAPLAVRTFHVDTNTFVAGMESAFGIKVESKGKETPSRKIQSALRELLTELNVAMDGNKAIFYNELTGTLMVRVAVDDLDVITAAIETLGGQAMGNYAMGFGTAGGMPSGMRR